MSGSKSDTAGFERQARFEPESRDPDAPELAEARRAQEALGEATAALWAAVEQSSAYARLQLSEARLQMALDASGMGTFVWHVEENRAEPDRRTLALFGLPPGALLSYGDVLDKWIHPDDRDRYVEAVSMAVDPAGPGTLREEIRIQREDGGVRWLAISARTEFARALDGRPARAARMSGIAADITERKQREATIASDLADTRLLQTLSAQLIEGQDSSSLYETIVAAASSIMRSEFASLQTVSRAPETAGRLRLIAASGFGGVPAAWEWVSPDGATTCALSLRAGTRVVAPDILHFEAMAGTKDQAMLLAAGVQAAQSTPLVSRRGKLLGMISTHWTRPHQPSERDLRLLDILARQAADLMERTQAEEDLRRNERELKEADRRKDEFLAVLAHELRNPLAPLRTSLELIRLAGDTQAAVADVRTMMEAQIAHMVRLIEDLLDVSRFTSGKIRLQRQPTPLVTLVNTTIEAHREAFTAGQVALSVDLVDAAVMLDVDPTRFVQVLSNVVHNAIKFTAPGGHVRISAAVADRPNAGREVTLVVADSGAGISKDLLPRIFDLFTQEENVTDRKHDGLGIGLALARRLVELHGGTIDAHSDGPGQGSQFTMRFPVPASLPETNQPEPRSQPERASRRVVVIDDNRTGANALQRLVVALGGECRIAYNGETGLGQVLAFRPDIVFVDIGMPGIDGYETCRRIRASVGPEVLLVAMTGWGRDRDKEAAELAGFDRHFTKPADPVALEALITHQDLPALS